MSKKKYTPRKPKICTCSICTVEYESRSHRNKYCPSCRKHVDLGQSRLNVKRRLTRLVANAQNRSNKKHLPINIDYDYIRSLWDAQQGKCSITGKELDLSSWGEKGQVNPYAPSIDRIIPSKGYVIGNVRLITYHCNIALSDFGEEQLLNLANDFIKYRGIS